jgi:hypothetical protein
VLITCTYIASYHVFPRTDVQRVCRYEDDIQGTWQQPSHTPPLNWSPPNSSIGSTKDTNAAPVINYNFFGTNADALRPRDDISLD